MRLVSKPLPKCRLCFSAGTQQHGTRGALPAAAGGCERGIPEHSCALHMPSACPSGRGSYSTSQVSVQAQGSLPSVKTSRAVIFSSSATGTKNFLPALSSWQKIGSWETGQRGQGGPVAHTLPGQEGAVAAQAIFNLVLLHTGSHLSLLSSFSVSLCVFAAPSCCPEMCELYMAWEIGSRQYF